MSTFFMFLLLVESQKENSTTQKRNVECAKID